MILNFSSLRRLLVGRLDRSRKHCQSARKQAMSMEWRQQNEWDIGAGSSVLSAGNFVKMIR